VTRTLDAVRQAWLSPHELPDRAAHGKQLRTVHPSDPADHRP